MGCSSSKLAGPNDFAAIDATPTPRHRQHRDSQYTSSGMRKAPRASAAAPEVVESPVSAEAYAHTVPTMTRSDRGLVNDEDTTLEPSSTVGSKSKEVMDGNGDMRKVEVKEVAESIQQGSISEQGGSGKSGRKPSLYQRMYERRMGQGEERDPVTGRGKLTGMTKEEIIEYVGRTRGAGMYSDRPYTFVSAGETPMGFC